MRAVCLGVAAALLLAALPAAAQNAWSFEARSLAMGNSVVAVADDSAAWLQNPAGLPYVQGRPDSRRAWPMRLSGTFDAGLEVETIGLNVSARNRAMDCGWGAGYWHLGKYEFNPYLSLAIDRFGAGYGMTVGSEWSVGLTVADVDMRWDIDFPMVPGQSPNAIAAYSGHKVIADLGLMHRALTPGGVTRAGLVVRDVADQMQVTVDVGASLLTDDGLLIAGQLRDLTDAVDMASNLGVEWRVPAMPELSLIAGLADGQVTYGAGYDHMPWTVSLATQHLDWTTQTAVTLCASF